MKLNSESDDNICTKASKTKQYEVLNQWLNNDIFTVGEIVIRPRLNCYLQNDSRLVSAIKEKILISPSSNQYNLDGRHTLGDGQPRLLDQRYFRERRKGGFFIEAGAYDGESESTTIHYELEHGWTGLLVEPLPTNFHRLLKKNRKVWAAQTCLSTQQSPETVDFSLSASSKQTMSGISGAEKAENQSDSVKMQCLPLFSLLQALGNPTVDFLSLDIEGAEYQVLKNIPWDLVDIRAIAVETQFAGEVMEGTRQDIVELLLSVGYTHLDSIARDDIFVKLEPNSHSSQLEMPDRTLSENRNSKMQLLSCACRSSGYSLPSYVPHGLLLQDLCG